MTPPFEHKCKRCDYEWLGKLENPKACPKCNSPYWNKLRTRIKFDENAIVANRTYVMNDTGKDFVHNQVYTKINDKPINEINLAYLKRYCEEKLHQGVTTIRGFIDDPLF